MKSYKDKGIIIKIKQFKEADKLVIILGEKYGRIEAVAKGAGKLLSKKTGVIDLLNSGNFSFHKTKGIDLLLEAELLDDYSEIKSELPSISEIFYLLEIIDRFMLGEGGDNTFYNELNWLIENLQSQSLNTDVLFSGLELKLLAHAGFTPLLAECIHCGDKLNPEEVRIAAASGDAGYMCSKHFSSSEMKNFIVEDNIIKIQKYILDNELTSLKQININESYAKRLRSIQKTWIEGILEKRLKSIQFINQVS